MMDNAKVEQQHQLYLKHREEKHLEEEAAKAETLKRRAELAERLAKIQKACEPHAATVIKAHKCTSCHATIPKGSRVMVEGNVTRVPISYAAGSSIAQFRSVYFCNACRPVKEA
jgi:uncharacterized protein with PIN domain